MTIEERRAYAKQYRQLNPDRVKMWQKKASRLYRLRHGDRIRARQKLSNFKYRTENRERYIAQKRKHYLKYKEHYIKQARAWYMKNRERVRRRVTLRHRMQMKTDPSYREKRRQISLRYHYRHRLERIRYCRMVHKTTKYAARQSVRNAVKRKQIIKPESCEQCGSKSHLHAHHYNGYENPLDIRWLCHICHGEAHHKPI